MREGTLSRLGRINVLELSGDYRQMGCEYGRIYKGRLDEFYRNAIEGHFIKIARMPYLRLLAVARLLYRRYPAQFKEMFSGMSEGSGIALNRLIMLDQVNVYEFMRSQNIGRCSNIAAWGEYAADGTLVFGRNFDQPKFFRKFNEFLTLAVFSPDDGAIPTANIGYPGQIGVNTAMNARGIFMANNEAPAAIDAAINVNVPSILIMELELMMRASSLDDLDERVRRTRANCPIIVSVADRERAYSYEWAVSGIKRRAEESDGFMVATNHFVDPGWGRKEPGPDIAEKTVERRRNLLSLADKNRGKFGVRAMQELLDITMEQGGATHPDKTTFQMVAVPAELTMYMKVPEFQDWTKIDLARMFDRTGTYAGGEKV